MQNTAEDRFKYHPDPDRILSGDLGAVLFGAWMRERRQYLG